MRQLLFLCIMLLVSCNNDELVDNMHMGDTPMDDTPCGVMDPIGFSASPLDESVLLQFGSIGHFDGPFRSCSPEAFDLFMSEDGVQFNLLTQIEASGGNHLVENLQNGETYSFRVTALHSELDPVESQVRTVKVGLLPLPQFIDFPLALPEYSFELFQLGPDGDKFLFRNASDDWYVSAFSNPIGNKVVDDAFSTKWNPHNDEEIIYRAKKYIQIATSTNGVTSKSVSSINLENGTEEVLHEISDNMDFGNEHKPEQYWIHNFNYSTDELSLYFESNKDNGSSTLFEKKVFNNIWKLDLNTKDIQPLSDFLPINFEMKSFVEDPKSPGNFYILGGTEGEVVEIVGSVFNPDKVDIYYYNTIEESLSLVLETIYEEEYLDINPSGDKLLIINNSSGREELWSYDLTSGALNQITQSLQYRYTKHRYYPNWITDTEFMTSVYHEDVLKLAVFAL